MPAVLVHGVPDTSRVWHAVISRLTRRDVVALSLPGFGRPVPAGFDATKDAYADWLLSELAGQTGPVDLVGHDWGALLVVRAVSLRPRSVRSWAVGAAPLDPDYEWHQAARLWQTPEVGERVMENLTAPALQKALVAAGVPAGDAEETARHADATMNDPYADARFGARLAERTGARFVCFPGCSHWWPLERPDPVAGELERFWRDV
jgi:pimeloyl-ACP methyl ester carboxylesterase